MAGITLPPAGSGHTFHDGCFFRSQREDRQERQEKKLGEPPVLQKNGLPSQEALPHKWTMEICPILVEGSNPSSATKSPCDLGPQGSSSAQYGA